MRKLWHWIWAANPYVVDGIIAAILLVTSLGSMFTEDGRVARTDGDAIGVILVLASTVPLAWRRQAPVRVFAIVVFAFATYFLRDYGDGGPSLAVAIAVWTVVTRDPLPRVSGIAAAGVPLIPLAWLLSDRPSLIGNAVSNALFFAGAAVAGHNVRLRREKRAQEDRAVEAIAGREVAEAERAVSDERMRIARELHDVVAHAMSIVAVQAGVAAHIIDEQPDEAKRMLENVRVTSHEALDEMRRLLGALRGGDAALAPAPGLADVGALVESMRESGVPTELRVGGAPEGVPAGVDLTGYRIVQEALTNVLKHAGAASATVDVQYARGLVIVEVADDGRGASVATSGGHGLLGMRERVAVYGGELLTGTKAGGGYRVRATLPFEAEPSPPPRAPE